MSPIELTLFLMAMKGTKTRGAVQVMAPTVGDIGSDPVLGEDIGVSKRERARRTISVMDCTQAKSLSRKAPEGEEC